MQGTLERSDFGIEKKLTRANAETPRSEYGNGRIEFARTEHESDSGRLRRYLRKIVNSRETADRLRKILHGNVGGNAAELRIEKKTFFGNDNFGFDGMFFLIVGNDAIDEYHRRLVRKKLLRRK